MIYTKRVQFPENSWSDNYLIDTNAVSQTVLTTYTNVYSYTGQGMLYGFELVSLTTAAFCRLTIDGNQVWTDLSRTTLNIFDFLTANSSKKQQGGIFTTVNSSIDFSMRYPIQFRTSVLIECRSTSGVSTSLTATLVSIAKEA